MTPQVNASALCVHPASATRARTSNASPKGSNGAAARRRGEYASIEAEPRSGAALRRAVQSDARCYAQAVSVTVCRLCAMRDAQMRAERGEGGSGRPHPMASGPWGRESSFSGAPELADVFHRRLSSAARARRHGGRRGGVMHALGALRSASPGHFWADCLHCTLRPHGAARAPRRAPAARWVAMLSCTPHAIARCTLPQPALATLLLLWPRAATRAG